MVNCFFVSGCTSKRFFHSRSSHFTFGSDCTVCWSWDPDNSPKIRDRRNQFSPVLFSNLVVLQDSTMYQSLPIPFPLLNWHISLHKHKHWSQGVEGEGELKKGQFEWDNMSPCAFKFSLAPFFRSVKSNQNQWKEKKCDSHCWHSHCCRTFFAPMSHRTAGIRTFDIRTLVSFALLTLSHCWHSHCWLRTGVVRTSVFRTLVVQANVPSCSVVTKAASTGCTPNKGHSLNDKAPVEKEGQNGGFSKALNWAFACRTTEFLLLSSNACFGGHFPNTGERTASIRGRQPIKVEGRPGKVKPVDLLSVRGPKKKAEMLVGALPERVEPRN